MLREKAVAFLFGAVASAAVMTWLHEPAATATAQEPKLPFTPSTEQRQQTVEELRKLNALMQKQIDLLTSGRVKVVVVEDKPEAGRRRGE